MEMIPGAAQQLRDVDSEELDKQIRQIEAIINSMTVYERQRPKILNASRRKRIAAGSGSTVQDVNQLIKRYRDTQKLMKKMSKSQRLPANINSLFNR